MILLKNPKQIKGIKESCRIAAATLNYIEPFVQSGITTKELDFICHDFIRRNGGISATLNYKGFPEATCISVNEVVCHGVPGDYKVKDGDIVNIDITTIRKGYYGDTARTFAVGKISDEASQLLEITKKCLEIGIREAKPGNYIGNIGYEISRYCMLQRVSVVEAFCGHGVGLEFHETPVVPHVAPKDSGPVMQPGMTFTIEPMINLGGPDVVIDEKDGWTVRTADGSLSAQFEHTVLITKSGCEILTEIQNGSKSSSTTR